MECLVSALETCIESDALDEKENAKRTFSFALEQIKLSLVDPKQRRYSPGLLACAMMWQNTSTALYKLLLSEKVLCLPSIRHLKRLSKAIEVDTGVNDTTIRYLKARAKNLNTFQRTVILLIDEIHTPDSSRYFYADGYEERQEKGEPQKQLSKEFVREWLMENGFQGLESP